MYFSSPIFTVAENISVFNLIVDGTSSFIRSNTKVLGKFRFSNTVKLQLDIIVLESANFVSNPC